MMQCRLNSVITTHTLFSSLSDFREADHHMDDYWFFGDDDIGEFYARVIPYFYSKK